MMSRSIVAWMIVGEALLQTAKSGRRLEGMQGAGSAVVMCSRVPDIGRGRGNAISGCGLCCDNGMGVTAVSQSSQKGVRGSG